MPRTALRSHEPAVKALVARYAAAAARITRILQALDPSGFTAGKARRAKGAVEKVITELNRAARSWSRKNIGAVYGSSRQMAEARMTTMGVKRPKRARADRHPRVRGRLADRTFADLFKANRSIRQLARRYCDLMARAAEGVARVAEVQAFDSAEVRQFIDRTVRAAVTQTSKYNAGLAHLTSKDVAAKIRARLLKKIGGGDFITITGKDGIARAYNLKSYSELVARTRMRETQTEAVKEVCRQFDNDLVEIPRHDNPCPECAEYQGQVYSISGNHPKYPLLPDGGPPWHPNCEDVANPVSENALAARGR